MKKQLSKITFILSIAFLTSFTTSAQENEPTSEFQHVIKTNVVGYLAGQFQLAYEHVINPNFSAQLSAGFITGNGNGTLSGNSYQTQRAGFIVIPEGRYYFAGRAPERMYIGAFLRYRYANNDLTDQSWVSGGTGINQDLSRERKVNSVGGGLIVGYQAITRGGFSFDIYAGPQFKYRSTTITYDNNALNQASTNGAYDSVGDELFDTKFFDFDIPNSSNIGLRFGFNIGYAF